MFQLIYVDSDLMNSYGNSAHRKAYTHAHMEMHFEKFWYMNLA